MTRPPRSAIPCNCGRSAVIITDFEEWKDDPREVYVEFGIGANSGEARFRHRLKIAWRIVRGKDPWLHGISLQTEAVEQLRAALAGRATDS